MENTSISRELFTISNNDMLGLIMLTGPTPPSFFALRSNACTSGPSKVSRDGRSNAVTAREFGNHALAFFYFEYGKLIFLKDLLNIQHRAEVANVCAIRGADR